MALLTVRWVSADMRQWMLFGEAVGRWAAGQDLRAWALGQHCLL